MKNNNDDMEKLSSKAILAKRNLSVIGSEVECMKKLLNELNDLLKTIIEKMPEICRLNEKEKVKEIRRSMIYDLPPRIKFCMNRLIFFIDFTVLPTRDGSGQGIEGAIIYGASRTLCFNKIKDNKKKQCKTFEACCDHCERTGRCDGLEDKTFLKLLINRYGAIRSGELEDEWQLSLCAEDTGARTTKKDKLAKGILTGIHYRAMDKIWRDALEWTNENILL
jgi:hypothetical protein